PSEAQYNARLNKVYKYLEVTDVKWSAEGFTPHWRPTIQQLTAEPMSASQETWDVIGYNKSKADATGYVEVNKTNVQDFSDVTDHVINTARTNVPERGSSTYNIA